MSFFVEGNRMTELSGFLSGCGLFLVVLLLDSVCGSKRVKKHNIRIKNQPTIKKGSLWIRDDSGTNHYFYKP